MIPGEITPEVILGIIHRRKWVIFVPFLLAVMIGLFLALTIPREYKAETVILVNPPRVPESYVKPIVTGGLEDRLRSISQQILSRSRLEKVIKKLNLYPELVATKPMDEVIEKMREDIEVKTDGKKRRRGRGEPFNLFTVSFTYPDPRTAADVVNSLASLFIEENLKIREERAVGTTEFLEKELQRLKKKLEVQEKALKDYKSQHFGELPEQLQANITTLQRLQVELQSVQESLSAAKQRKLIIQQYAYQPLTGTQGTNQAVAAPGPAKLQTLYDTLDELKSRYTDKHPDIIRLKQEIAKLEKEYGAELKNGEKKKPSKRMIGDPAMQRELINVESEIARLQSEEKSLKKAIKLYQMRVDNTPKREQELASLSRDYNITLKSYQDLLSRRIEAKMSENLEKKQQGEQFSVIDPATPPQIPFKPDIKKVLLISLFLGIGSGCGLAFALEYLDPTFHDKNLLEKTFEIPVLASIPIIYTPKEKRKKWIMRVVYAAVVVSVIIGYSFALYYIKKNNFYLNINLPFLS